MHRHEDTKGNGAFYFILKDKVSKDKQVAHARLVCVIRPQKKEMYCTHLAASDNLINYLGNTSTLTIGIATIETY